LAKLDIQDKSILSKWLPVKVNVATTLELGNVVTGHGSVLVSGKLVHLDTNCHRLWIQAMSAPGSSGCPLFDNQKQLVALVHGSSKHCHHKTKIERISGTVYGDATLGRGHTFQAVKDDKMLRLLQMAEELTEEEARNSHVSTDSDNCPDVTKKLHHVMCKASCVPHGTQNGEIHWDYLMKLLAGKALEADNDIRLGNELDCMAPQ
jgi:hypothetical protein